MEENIEDLTGLFKILGDDYRQSINILEKDFENQFKRRAIIHFLFAFIEGNVSLRKQMTLAWHNKHGLGKFSETEILWLKDEPYDGTTKERKTYQRRFLSFEENVKFSFKASYDAFSLKSDLNLGNDPRWMSFIHAVKVRHRITHPKSVNDLKVSDDDMRHINDAFWWFHEKSTTLSETITFILKSLKTSKPNEDM